MSAQLLEISPDTRYSKDKENNALFSAVMAGAASSAAATLRTILKKIVRRRFLEVKVIPGLTLAK